MKIYALLSVLTIFITLAAVFSTAIGDNEPVLSCPEMCAGSREKCEDSCSQLVGGGAKSAKRRECIRECGVELEGCEDRCLNPTPRPTIKPEAYYDKACKNACEFKLADCYEVCTKYLGGGAKSGKRTTCRRECEESLDSCRDWCVNPTPRPDIKLDPYEDMPCPQVCKYKLDDCETRCSKYMGGGAKSGKRNKCIIECRDGFQECSGLCGE